MRPQKTELFLLLGLGVLIGGCRAAEVSIMVKALQPLDADCRVETEYSIGKGALNLNANSEYLLSVVMESLVEGVDVEGAEGRLLSSEKENRVILTEWTRRTSIYGTGGTSKLILEESEPLAGILEPNAASQLYIPLSMVGSSAADALRNVLQQAGGGISTDARGFTGTEVVVRFQIRGRIVSSGKKIETAPVDFPISVFLGEPLPVCEGEEVLAPVGPCGLHGGQDSFHPICCVFDASSGKCKN